jgi:riboflavin kinase/FMN adenylyltransferase
LKITPIEEIKKLNIQPVISVGMFDGVHSGHQKLLSILLEKAKAYNTLAAVVTFSNHPRFVLDYNLNCKPVLLLQTYEERMKSLSHFGIKNVYTIDFSERISKLSPAIFLDFIIEKLNPYLLLMGYDNSFGNKKDSDLANILHNGKYQSMAIKKTDACVFYNGLEVSSTQIRNALKEGNIKLANIMLNYFYTLSGKVIKGYKKGRGLGFPTANLKVDALKLIPKCGVYAVHVVINKRILEGVMFIGERKTFDLNDLTIEVHIFNFNTDIYNKNIEVQLVDFIREQQRFASVEDLIQQIKNDCEYAKQIFKLNSDNPFNL